MVKIIISLFVLLSVRAAFADVLFGVSTNSWQEKIPVVIQGQQSDLLASFSSSGVNLGFDYLFQKRIRYALVASYIVGRADLHKVDNAISPRRNFNSTWLANKLHWRKTKTFSYGVSFILNQRKLDGLDPALSSGLFLDFDYDLFDQVRLTQSLGTMSDSQQLAYALTVTRIF